jgi:hypothetical protein
LVANDKLNYAIRPIDDSSIDQRATLLAGRMLHVVQFYHETNRWKLNISMTTVAMRETQLAAPKLFIVR